MATKAVFAGGVWLLLIAVVLAAHGAAFAALQLGFQRGRALATAGTSALLTNALPIAAGITVFHEHLPGGAYSAVRIASFAAVVAGAALLAHEPSRETPGRFGTNEVEEPELEELARHLQRVVAQLRRLAPLEVEPARRALDRLVERRVAVERRQRFRGLQLELEVGARSLVEHDPDLLHVAVPVELLVEPHLLGEPEARARDGDRAVLGEQRERREDALDLVARELELLLVDRVGANQMVVARRACASAPRPR